MPKYLVEGRYTSDGLKGLAPKAFRGAVPRRSSAHNGCQLALHESRVQEGACPLWVKVDMRPIEPKLNMRQDGPGFISAILRRPISK